MGIKKTQEEFEKEVIDMVGDEYTFLEDYKGVSTKIKVRHNKCGDVYYVSPLNFRRSKGCKKCNYNLIYSHKVKDDKQFKDEVKELVGNEYTFLDCYVNTYTDLNVIHNTCGNRYKISPRDFLKGSRCRKCFVKSRTWTNEYWKSKVEELGEGEYVPISEYKSNGLKVDMKHKPCGNIYSVKVNNFLEGNRCPYCKSSNGEINMLKYFKDNDIEFYREKTFDGLLGNRNPLKFDFYLPKYNLLIEFQGIQHYKPVEFFGGEVSFKSQKMRDNRKREYTRKHNYNYIEIPFYVSSYELIREKLDYELKKYYSVKQGNLNQN